MDIIEKAINFAVEAHLLQKRKHSGIPYVTHCIEVMKRVSDYGVANDKLLASAILHDVIEDCDERFVNQIEGQFGSEVYSIVKECTRESGDGADKSQKYEFLESFKSKSVQSIVIKIADRFCNVSDYRRTDEAYAAEYALQAYPLYRTFISRELYLAEDVSITREAGIRILADIVDLNVTIDGYYKGFSSFTCNNDLFVKERVL